MYTLQRFEKNISVEDYIKTYVNVGEFLEYCKECRNYGRVWSCPPYDFEPEKYWNEFAEFTVIGYKIDFGKGFSQDRSLEIMAEVKRKLTEELFELENAFEGSVSLSAGSCSICVEKNQMCTRPQNEPCRYPDKMRFSIESLGGNVGKTVHDLLGIPLCWIEEGKVPPYFVLAGGLLKKQPKEEQK